MKSVQTSTTEDWIEIYNPTAEVVNVADWTIGDEAEMVAIGELVEDSSVPAGGFLLVMTKVLLEDGSEIGFGSRKMVQRHCLLPCSLMVGVLKFQNPWVKISVMPHAQW